MFKVRLVLLGVFLFICSSAFSAVTKTQANEIAYKTWSAIRNINLVLARIKKKNDINPANKEAILAEVAKLKEIKKELKKIKRNANDADLKLLNSHFNKGPYSVALRKAAEELFSNISRIKKIEGGEVIAQLLIY